MAFPSMLSLHGRATVLIVKFNFAELHSSSSDTFLTIFSPHRFGVEGKLIMKLHFPSEQ